VKADFSAKGEIMTILRRNNWTKLGLVLSLMFSVFSISAIAQDKPLTAKALAGLITDLKEVVSKNAPDETDARLIKAKWNARKDLTGKTKSAVIELLYDDVKSVIKDSGVQYQIYSIFSFYKTIPDEQFSKNIQKTKPATSKPVAVKQLVELTFRMHPYIGIEEMLSTLPGTKDIKAEEERVRKFRIEGFEEALKTNNKLTPEQKTFVRANYDQLIKIVDKITEDTINKNFPTEQWIKEGLQKSYTAKFTLKELNSLVTYFQGTAGQPVLKYIRQTKMAELIIGNGGKPDYTEQDKAEYEKFSATLTGKKFLHTFLDEAIEYQQNRENAVRSKTPNADGFAIYEPANLIKFFNKFVAENYKK
jgi:hypothetical protein